MLRLSHCFLVLAFAAVASLGSIAEASAGSSESEVAIAVSDSWSQTDPAGFVRAQEAPLPHADVHVIEVAEPTSKTEVEADGVDEAPDMDGVEAALLDLLSGQRACAQFARSAIERSRLVLSTRLAQGPPQYTER